MKKLTIYFKAFLKFAYFLLSSKELSFLIFVQVVTMVLYNKSYTLLLFMSLIKFST